MNTGKCARCGNTLAYVLIEPLDINRGERAAYHGVSYCCPSCHAVLSVGIDPIALKTEIIAQMWEQAERQRAGLLPIDSQDCEDERAPAQAHTA